MRHSMIALIALALAAGCAHEAHNTTDGHSVASTPGGAGGDVVTACGNGRVFFASGSSELDGAARARLDTYADCLTRHETDVVYVSGTTDPEGTEEENVTLGRARARAVADHLHAAGCNVDFVIRTYGESDAPAGEPLWPLERSASSTAVVN
jgi:outer membrane protein OmpA-like peptidoglycan-associated protein